MLRQVLASTVKARAGDADGAATAAATAATLLVAGREEARASASAAASTAEYGAATSGHDEYGEGGGALFDGGSGSSELLFDGPGGEGGEGDDAYDEGEEVYIVEIDGEQRVLAASDLHALLAQHNALAHPDEQFQIEFVDEHEDDQEHDKPHERQ